MPTGPYQNKSVLSDIKNKIMEVRALFSEQIKLSNPNFVSIRHSVLVADRTRPTHIIDTVISVLNKFDTLEGHHPYSLIFDDLQYSPSTQVLTLLAVKEKYFSLRKGRMFPYIDILEKQPSAREVLIAKNIFLHKPISDCWT